MYPESISPKEKLKSLSVKKPNLKIEKNAAIFLFFLNDNFIYKKKFQLFRIESNLSTIFRFIHLELKAPNSYSTETLILPKDRVVTFTK